MNPEPTCRVCFEEETPEQDLVSPCSCSGSVRYIHKHCLRKELEARSRLGIPITYCTICHGEYTWVPFKNENTYPFLTIPLSISLVTTQSYFDPAMSAIIALLLVFTWGLLLVPWFGFLLAHDIRIIGNWTLRVCFVIALLSKFLHINDFVYLLSWSLITVSPLAMMLYRRVEWSLMRFVGYSFYVMESGLLLYYIHDRLFNPSFEIMFAGSLVVPAMFFMTIEVG